MTNDASGIHRSAAGWVSLALDVPCGVGSREEGHRRCGPGTAGTFRSAIRSWYLALFLLVALSGTPITAQESTETAITPPPGWARVQPVDVDEAGWVATRLGPEAARHLGIDLSLLAPDGGYVTLHRPQQAGRRAARIRSVEPAREGARDGFHIRLDLGAEPPRHTRLFFQVASRVTAPDCVLEVADAAGGPWRPLVRGGLFRLGDADDLQSLALDYPASAARHLRLFWPAGAGTPQLDSVAVLIVGEGADLAALEPSCSEAGMVRRCQIRTDGLALQRIDVRLSTPSLGDHFGVRLWSVHEGAWQLGAEETRHLVDAASGADAETVVRLAVPGRASGTDLRLEAAGSGTAPPVVLGVDGWVDRPAVAFEADQAGRHLLVWGATSMARAVRPGGVPERVAWRDAGTIGSGAWPALPEALAAPGAALPDATFARSWPLRSDAAAGDLVRLELSHQAVQSARRDLGDLRLATDEGRQIPHVVLPLDRPETVFRGRLEPAVAEPGSAASSTAAHGTSVAEITMPLAENDVPITTATLYAPGPFDRTVTLEWLVPADRRRPAHAERIHKQAWSCDAPGPLPCALRVGLSAHAGRRMHDTLRLTVDDGDDPPLPWVDVELLTRRYEVLFVRPPGDVWLHADAPALTAPRYDLARLEALLRLRPAVDASLGDAEDALPAAPSWSGGLLYAALGLAVLVLLGLLSRMLGEAPPPSDPADGNPEGT